jgi:formylmethanofuran dehydrogenase subunit E
MELSLSLDEHLALSAALHRRLCPRQILGVRMARLACGLLGVDPLLERRRLYVYMENGHCLADGVIAVTCASPTNRRMQLLPYGKMAATFADRVSGLALRVWEHPACRDRAMELEPGAASPYAAHLQAYRRMPDETLLAWQPVQLREPLPEPPAKHSVVCERCGERIHEHAELECDGLTLCRGCAGGVYYEMSVGLLG